MEGYIQHLYVDPMTLVYESIWQSVCYNTGTVMVVDETCYLVQCCSSI